MSLKNIVPLLSTKVALLRISNNILIQQTEECDRHTADRLPMLEIAGMEADLKPYIFGGHEVEKAG